LETIGKTPADRLVQQLFMLTPFDLKLSRSVDVFSPANQAQQRGFDHNRWAYKDHKSVGLDLDRRHGIVSIS